MKRLKKILPPGYAWIPLALVLFFNMFVYYGSRMFNKGRQHYMLALGLDSRIPVCTVFIVFYFLAYVQWICGYLLAARESRRVCYEVTLGDLLAKAVVLVLFLAVPTMIQRPELEGHSFFDILTGWMYRLDAPDNLFPSIHCLESWICFRSSFRIRKVPRWYPAASFVLTVFVCASTVLLKQHFLVDIPAGILLAELGLAAAARILRTRTL